jgi:DNA-binding GntR family transcriptional regulator
MNKKAKVVTSTDEVYEIIMDAIVTQQLKPSQKVSESILAELFGVSRSLARNAIERLTAQRFLISVSPRVTLVAPLTLLDVKQNFVLRKILQPNIWSMATPFSNVDELIALNDKLITYENLIDNKSRLEALKLNKNFNVSLAKYINYPLLAHWSDQVENTSMRVYWVYMNLKGSLPFKPSQQFDLIQFAKNNRPKEIEDRVRQMLELSESMVLDAIIQNDQFYSQDLVIARN